MNLIYFNQIVLEYKHEQNTKLKRSLGLPLVVLYGLGNILGAGIYVLVGKVAGFAGTSTTLAFLIALAIAAFTGFSYMELAGRYPVSASVSVYLYKAFGKRWLSVFVGLAMVAGGIASAAALAQGFAGYLHSFIAIPTIVGSIGLLVVLGVIAIRGVSASAKTAALFTIIEVFGLLLVIWFGKHSFSHIDAGSVFTIDPSVGLSGVVSGAFLAFYAFNGFEDMVNVSEETKKSEKNDATRNLTLLSDIGDAVHTSGHGFDIAGVPN
ncbi:MAG: amino acid permease [Candidatus Saccharibacteria bacterium]